VDAETKAVSLDYARPPRWHRRRRWRLTVAAFLVLAIGVAVAWKREPLIAKLKLHYYEAACMRYRAPAGAVAMEFDPEKAKLLIGGGGDYVGGTFYATDGLPAVLVPKALRGYMAAPTKSTDAVLFLRRRISPGGDQRLVVVEIDSMSWIGQEEDGAGEFAILSVSARSTPSMTWLSWQRPVSMPSDVETVLLTRNIEYEKDVPKAALSIRTRFYCGQPDPLDASRFTIDYEVCGERDTIDGQLLDNGAVRLRPRRAKVLKAGWDILPVDPNATTSRRPTTAATQIAP
jgi:hypothetical protein